VAYFHRPSTVKGSEAYTSQWQGVTWRFVSAEHRDLFAADPVHYAPQYGGYCAYAISHGTTAHGDPNQWAVVDDRLVVNNNPLGAQTLGVASIPQHPRRRCELAANPQARNT